MGPNVASILGALVLSGRSRPPLELPGALPQAPAKRPKGEAGSCSSSVHLRLLNPRYRAPAREGTRFAVQHAM